MITNTFYKSKTFISNPIPLSPLPTTIRLEIAIIINRFNDLNNNDKNEKRKEKN